MGLAKLNSTERAALQRWIAMRLPTAMRTASLDAILVRSLEAPGAPRTFRTAYPGLGQDYGIASVQKQGVYVRLADGFLWEILSTGRGFVST